MIDFFSKLSLGRGVQIAMLIFGNIVAPYWFLQHFKPQLVNNDRILQQIIFALAVGIPLNICWYVIMRNYLSPHGKPNQNYDQKDTEKYRFKKMTVACALGTCALYIPILASFFWNLSLREAVYIVSIASAAMYIDSLRDIYLRKKAIKETDV